MAVKLCANATGQFSVDNKRCFTLRCFFLQEERSKQVVMGKLPVFESFGEVSCVTGEPMTCSIITATAVQIGVIEPEQLEGNF